MDWIMEQIQKAGLEVADDWSFIYTYNQKQEKFLIKFAKENYLPIKLYMPGDPSIGKATEWEVLL